MTTKWFQVSYAGRLSEYAHSFSLDPDDPTAHRAETACGRRPFAMPQYPDVRLLGFAPADEEVPRCPACRHALTPPIEELLARQGVA